MVATTSYLVLLWSLSSELFVDIPDMRPERQWLSMACIQGKAILLSVKPSRQSRIVFLAASSASALATKQNSQPACLFGQQRRRTHMRLCTAVLLDCLLIALVQGDHNALGAPAKDRHNLRHAPALPS